MTHLPCTPCGRVRGKGSLRKNEGGSMSVPRNLNVIHELVEQNILDFTSGI